MSATSQGVDLSHFFAQTRHPQANWLVPDHMLKPGQVNSAAGDKGITGLAKDVLGLAAKYIGKGCTWLAETRLGKAIIDPVKGVAGKIASPFKTAASKTARFLGLDKAEKVAAEGAADVSKVTPATKTAITTGIHGMSTAEQEAMRATLPGMKPAIAGAGEVAGIAAKEGSVAAKGLGVLGKFSRMGVRGIPLVGTGVIAVTESFHNGEFDWKRGAAAVAGSAVGGVAGAATGAVVGSVVPVAGTAVGALLFEGAGQITGSIAATSLYDRMKASGISPSVTGTPRPFANTVSSVSISSPSQNPGDDPLVEGLARGSERKAVSRAPQAVSQEIGGF